MTNKRKSYRAGATGRRGRLNVTGKEEGFVYRIVNDDVGRVMELQERGYDIVPHDNVTVGDKRVGMPQKVGSPIEISVGGGKKAYLMRIRQDWYDEDQAAKQEEIHQLENSLQGDSGSDYGKLEISRK